MRHLLPFVQFKKREEHPWRNVILVVKLQALACNFTKGNTQWVLFPIFKLYKRYQITQLIAYVLKMGGISLISNEDFRGLAIRGLHVDIRNSTI